MAYLACTAGSFTPSTEAGSSLLLSAKVTKTLRQAPARDGRQSPTHRNKNVVPSGASPRLYTKASSGQSFCSLFGGWDSVSLGLVELAAGVAGDAREQATENHRVSG